MVNLELVRTSSESDLDEPLTREAVSVMLDEPSQVVDNKRGRGREGGRERRVSDDGEETRSDEKKQVSRYVAEGKKTRRGSSAQDPSASESRRGADQQEMNLEVRKEYKRCFGDYFPSGCRLTHSEKKN